MSTTTTSLLLGVSAVKTTTNHHHHRILSLTSPNLPFSHFPIKFNPLKLSSKHPPKPSFTPFSSLNPNSPPNPLPQIPQIPNSTQTLATLLSLTLSISTRIAQIITNSFTKIKSLCQTPTAHELQTIQYLQENDVCTIGPLFFAAVRDRPSVHLNTPLTVVAAGMAKWLDIYSGVLLVRVLLSWFPNIPWDRQPLSAIRDLCDPYLNLFRNIIPPIFDTLDISPLFAFTVLGVLGSILNSAKGI